MFNFSSFFLNLRVFDNWYGNRPSFIAQGTRIACIQHSATLPHAFVYVSQLPRRLVRYGHWSHAKTTECRLFAYYTLWYKVDNTQLPQHINKKQKSDIFLFIINNWAQQQRHTWHIIKKYLISQRLGGLRAV